MNSALHAFNARLLHSALCAIHSTVRNTDAAKILKAVTLMLGEERIPEDLSLNASEADSPVYDDGYLRVEHDSYNAFMLTLSRRFNTGLLLNAQYTLGRSFGNTQGSNEALTAGNNARQTADFEYDNGYNLFDIRHNYNVSAV